MPDGGSAVMYRPGKILKTGTSVDPDAAIRQAAATAYVLDMTQGSPAWTQVPSMNFARTYHTLVLLPDGNVLVTNGGPTTDAVGVNTAVLQAEMWSPGTQAFTKLASMATPRLYHSTALLLPDARILVAGGGRFNGLNEPTDQLSSEIYSPPYLFKGTRPVISSTPATIQYATSFSITTPDASQITSAMSTCLPGACVWTPAATRLATTAGRRTPNRPWRTSPRSRLDRASAFSIWHSPKLAGSQPSPGSVSKAITCRGRTSISRVMPVT